MQWDVDMEKGRLPAAEPKHVLRKEITPLQAPALEAERVILLGNVLHDGEEEDPVDGSNGLGSMV